MSKIYSFPTEKILRRRFEKAVEAQKMAQEAVEAYRSSLERARQEAISLARKMRSAHCKGHESLNDDELNLVIRIERGF